LIKPILFRNDAPQNASASPLFLPWPISFSPSALRKGEE